VAQSPLYRDALLEGAHERELPADYIKKMLRDFEGPGK
jgi:hypothetical protein